ncbi:hypothetical protein FDECE_9081 [Fusarium decemcellulare]|nr:hypothetical protein FDECE_9081 [Fusarium decemcellulare]
MERFKGKIVHTAEWDPEYDYRGKRMAVIGNGCSAAQVIPSVVRDTSYLKQYARGAQWYHERPNQRFSSLQQSAFKHIPLYHRWFRFRLFAVNDSLAGLYASGPDSVMARKEVEAAAKEYIYSRAPAKYHDCIVPDFPLGCKRRIWDPGYLDSLWEKNFDLAPEGIREFDETGIVSSSGIKDDFDIIVTATGFEVTDFLVPMKITGSKGRDLRDQWKDTRGAQAYYGCFVHDFPNFAMLFGPNTFPAHNSALFAIETSLEFITKTMLVPILDRQVRVVDVRHSAEERFANRVHEELELSVYESGCSNWFVNEHGRNVTSWPGYAVLFYIKTLFPNFKDFNTVPGSHLWLFYRMKRWYKTSHIPHTVAALTTTWARLPPVDLRMDSQQLPNYNDIPAVEGMPHGCAWGLWGKKGQVDQVGSLNLLTPDNVIKAKQEIQTGVSVSLNWPLERIEDPGHNRTKIVHKFLDLKPNLVGHDDEIYINTQTSSQWDGLRHWAHQPTGKYYNGLTHEEISGPNRNLRNGMQGMCHEDLEQIAHDEEVELRVGDILMVRTGWIKWYNEASSEERVRGCKTNHNYVGVEGTAESIRWLWDHHFSALVGDNMAFEAWPADGPYRIHDNALALWGTPLGELWDLEQLAAQCKSHGRWSFFVTSCPLNVAGGVASPSNALAIF